MNKTALARRLAALSTLSAAGLFPLAAGAADYTYLEGGFIDRHDYGRSGAGGRVAGAFDLHTLPLAVIAEFTGTDKLDQVDAGVIYHVPINRMFDFFAGATLEHADRDGDTDTGVGGRAGVRWQLNNSFELAPEFRYVHLFHEDEASVRLNALLNVASHLDLQGAIQGGDEQRYEVGVRYNFGGRI
jgi:hypothetical protein